MEIDIGTLILGSKRNKLEHLGMSLQYYNISKIPTTFIYTDGRSHNSGVSAAQKVKRM